MKQGKIVLLVIFILLISSIVYAQGITAKGIKGGINIATLTGDDVEDAESKIGFVFGGFVSYEVNDAFCIQPEVLFTMKGTKMSGQGYEVSQNLNYIEIPILAKLNIAMDGNAQPNLFFGPAVGLNLSATYKIESDYGDDDGDIEDVAPMDIGIIFGGGVEFGNILIDARYDMGLTSIDDSSENFKVKNSVISIMLGMLF